MQNTLTAMTFHGTQTDFVLDELATMNPELAATLRDSYLDVTPRKRFLLIVADIALAYEDVNDVTEACPTFRHWLN